MLDPLSEAWVFVPAVRPQTRRLTLGSESSSLSEGVGRDGLSGLQPGNQ